MLLHNHLYKVSGRTHSEAATEFIWLTMRNKFSFSSKIASAAYLFKRQKENNIFLCPSSSFTNCKKQNKTDGCWSVTHTSPQPLPSPPSLPLVGISPYFSSSEEREHYTNDIEKGWKGQGRRVGGGWLQTTAMRAN